MKSIRHHLALPPRALLVASCMLLAACTGIARHIDGPLDHERNYYIPEKGVTQVQSLLPNDLGEREGIRFYRSFQAVDRYFLAQMDQFGIAGGAQDENALACNVPAVARLNPYRYQAPPLSPGDRVQIAVEDGEEFSGVFEVNLDGTLGLPLIPPVFAAGQGVREVEQMIRTSLVQEKLFKPDFLRLSIRPQQWAAIQVQVQGAVFDPGLVTINSRSAEDRNQQSTQWSGDSPTGRLLNAALLAAGGIRPDANISKVYLLRGTNQQIVDLSGVLAGNFLQLPALASGDRIYVPSTGGFNRNLVRTSQITPPGVRVFISNLTQPSNSNASSAIGKHTTSLPYGTRLLTAAISANCVGGSASSNSNRTAVLVSRNPISGETEVIERSLEHLLLHRNRDSVNPHIMPNDGIACYDSGVTNLREVGRTLTDILLPFSLF